MLRDDAGGGWLHRVTIERFLLRHMLFRKPVEVATWKLSGQTIADEFAELEHACREKFDHDRLAKSIDDQPTQAIPFGVDDAVCVGDIVKFQRLTAKLHRSLDHAGEECLVDFLVAVATQ